MRRGFMPYNRIVEVCVDSVEGAIAAQEGGAGRVELCANLAEGGTTPSAATIQVTRENISIPMHVLIRPRGGDFCYSALEFETMRRDLEWAKELGGDGVVFGILTEDGDVDMERTRALVYAARPMAVTCERTIDVAADASQTLDRLIALGIERVITSGQENSSMQALDLLRSLVQCAADRIIIMPCGGVSASNVGRILQHTGASEVHVSSATRVAVESRMRYRNPRVAMGGDVPRSEYSWDLTDPQRVREIIQAIEIYDDASLVSRNSEDGRPIAHASRPE
jgi:copper homeostasis protein